MNDDDIPILTRVVRRERRAFATMTPAVQDAVLGAVNERCETLVASLVEAAAVDIDALLTERITEKLRAELPGMIEQALAETLAASMPDPDEDAPS